MIHEPNGFSRFDASFSEWWYTSSSKHSISLMKNTAKYICKNNTHVTLLFIGIVDIIMASTRLRHETEYSDSKPEPKWHIKQSAPTTNTQTYHWKLKFISSSQCHTIYCTFHLHDFGSPLAIYCALPTRVCMCLWGEASHYGNISLFTLSKESAKHIILRINTAHVAHPSRRKKCVQWI